MGVRNSEGYMELVPYKAIANIDREKKAEKRSAFRPLVYICSLFSGDIEGNKKKAIEFVAHAYKNGCIPVPSYLLFPFMNDENTEERIIGTISVKDRLKNQAKEDRRTMQDELMVWKC